VNQEAFLPTIGHSCGPPCVLLVYGFTEHKGDLVWLIVVFQASAYHYHNLMTCQGYTAHSLEATGSEMNPLFDGGRGRRVCGADICIQVVVLTGCET